MKKSFKLTKRMGKPLTIKECNEANEVLSNWLSHYKELSQKELAQIFPDRQYCPYQNLHQ